MKTKSTIREVMAWILLAFAMFLFSATIVLAQEESTGKTTIKIMKKEKGKTTKIDTTFNSKDDEAIRKILKDLDLDDDMSFEFSVPESPSEPGEGHRQLKFKYDGMSKEDRDDLKNEMESLDEEMSNLREKMKDMHIEIFSDKEGEGKKGYSYHFEMPPIPAIPDCQDGTGSFSRHGFSKMRHHRFFSPVPDSLDDDDRAIIMADDDEMPRVFEKEIVGKHGEKVFVYKRMKPAERKTTDNSLNGNDIMLYPNPNNGMFSLNFHSDTKGSLTIKVYDAQGKEVYSKSVKDFNGEYVGQFDMTKKGKGSFILKISQDDKTYMKKFIIE